MRQNNKIKYEKIYQKNKKCYMKKNRKLIK